jgi:hypothetical protein
MMETRLGKSWRTPGGIVPVLRPTTDQATGSIDGLLGTERHSLRFLAPHDGKAWPSRLLRHTALPHGDPRG